jgi:hypothetical protein
MRRKKKKPYKTRRVYKMKAGGPKFWRSGKFKGGAHSAYVKPEEQAAQQRGVVSSVLQAMGFRVGDR